MTGNQGQPLANIHDPRLMLRRRDALKFGAAGAAALAGLGMLPRLGKADTQSTCLTQGPYWVDEGLFRQDVRSQVTSGVSGTPLAGLPLRLQISVSRLTGTVATPLVGDWVDIWHCSGAGIYSDAAANGTVGQNWLRGYQVTDSHGMVRFLTIYPGWYVGRTVHIHARIRTFSGTVTTQNFTTQLFFNDAVSTTIFANMASTYNSHTGTRTLNTGDGIYASVGEPGLVKQGNTLDHATASFNIKLTSTQGPCGLKTRAFDENGVEYACEDDHAFDFGGGTPSQALRRVYEC